MEVWRRQCSNFEHLKITHLRPLRSVLVISRTLLLYIDTQDNGPILIYVIMVKILDGISGFIFWGPFQPIINTMWMRHWPISSEKLVFVQCISRSQTLMWQICRLGRISCATKGDASHGWGVAAKCYKSSGRHQLLVCENQGNGWGRSGPGDGTNTTVGRSMATWGGLFVMPAGGFTMLSGGLSFPPAG